MSEPPPGAGLYASLRRLLASGLEIAQVRLDLLAVELAQEKERALDALFWALLAWLMVTVGTVLGVGLLLMLLWDGYRLPALALGSLGFLGAGAWMAARARQRLRSPGGPGAASRDELARDRAALQGQDAGPPPDRPDGR